MCGPSQQYNIQVCVCVCVNMNDAYLHTMLTFLKHFFCFITNMLCLFARVKLVAVYLRLNDGAAKEYLAQKRIRPL